MSYIRSITNPEELYIVGSHAGIEIYAGQDNQRLVPYDVFHTLLLKWYEEHEDVEYKGASLKCEHIGTGFRWVLRYTAWPDRSLVLWETTLQVVADDVKRRERPLINWKNLPWTIPQLCMLFIAIRGAIYAFQHNGPAVLFDLSGIAIGAIVGIILLTLFKRN